MLKIFAPSASTPPSANTKHCTTSTAVSAITAAPGPSNAAARTDPTKCPLVPPATGKLSICPAKMNAAANPSSGTRRGGRVRRASRNASVSAPTESASAARLVFRSRKPSGMCMDSRK